MKSNRSGRDEWLMLMTQIAALDRDVYRRLRAEAWARVVRSHAEKTSAQLSEWARSAS